MQRSIVSCSVAEIERRTSLIGLAKRQENQSLPGINDMMDGDQRGCG